MRRLFRVLIVAGLIGCGGGTTPVAHAPPVQRPNSSVPPSDAANSVPAVALNGIPVTVEAIDVIRFAPKSAFMVIHVDIRKISESAVFKDMKPGQIPTAIERLKTRLFERIKVADWESGTMFVAPNLKDVAAYLGVLRTPQARIAFLKSMERDDRVVSEVKHREIKYTRYTSKEFPSVHCALMVGDRALFLGSQAAIHEIIEAQGASLNPALATLFESAPPGQLRMAVNVDAARALLIAEAKMAPFESPQLVMLPDWTKAATLSLDLSGDTLVRVQIDAMGEETADQWFGLAKSTWGMIAGGVAEMKPRVDAAPPNDWIRDAYAIAQDLIQLKAEQNGARVSLSIERPAKLDRLSAILEGLKNSETVAPNP